MADYDPTGTGAVTILELASEIRKTGRAIFLPFSEEKDAIDLIFKNKDGSLKTVQGKTGRLIKGAIDFQTRRSNRRHENSDGTIEYLRKPYFLGEFDFFGIYCPENNKQYLVPATQNILDHSRACLRVDTPISKNSVKNLRWAVDYEISYILDGDPKSPPSDKIFVDFKSDQRSLCAFCGRNHVKRASTIFCSIKCSALSQQNPNKPSKEELENLLKTTSKNELAAKYGVTTSCINLWIKSYSISPDGLMLCFDQAFI